MEVEIKVEVERSPLVSASGDIGCMEDEEDGRMADCKCGADRAGLIGLKAELVSRHGDWTVLLEEPPVAIVTPIKSIGDGVDGLRSVPP